MPKYKVSYSGFAYVEADSSEEAKESYRDDECFAYEEKHIDSVEEVDDFIITL